MRESIEVWVVYADDYDVMSQWLVGVYENETEAVEAAKSDENLYVKEGGKRSRYHSSVQSTILLITP